MNTLETTVRNLLDYYYHQSELDGGTDWDKLDELIYQVMIQYKKREALLNETI